ncbi:VanZ like family protein [Bacillus cereus]|nr:VanZ like family protein [Bacillus cereus]
MTIDQYIKRILQKANVSKTEKEDLYFEMYDHLTSLKHEFMEQGKSEQEATQLAIQNFGEASTLGIEIDKAMQSPSQKYMQWLGWGLFIPYSLILLSQLLLTRPSYNLDSITYFLETGNWHGITGLFNIVPFKTTLMYLTDFDHTHRDNLTIALMNTLGHIIIFIPFGFFIPLLFKKVNDIKLACTLFVKTSLFIELLQLITLTGIFDIDAIILNTIGALIGYSIYTGMKNVWVRFKPLDKIDII